MMDFLNWFFIETMYGIITGVVVLAALIGLFLFLRSRRPED